MKLIVKLYRVTTIPTAELIAVAGVDPEQALASGNPMPFTSQKLAAKIKEKFGSHPPRFKIFYPNELFVNKTTVGVEVMSFNILSAETPHAGLVLSDPLCPQDIDRVDGAIESELSRLGLGTDFEGYEWRQNYEVKGN